jgi:hypothetical protein
VLDAIAQKRRTKNSGAIAGAANLLEASDY